MAWLSQKRKQLLRWIRAHPRLLAETAVLAVLLAVLVYKVGGSLLHGDAPLPQIPPNGYVAYENRIYLRWFPGDHEGPFQVQVFDIERGFDEAVFNRQLTKNNVVLPVLEPGRKYCWRVLDSYDAHVSCFKTSRSFMAY
jgi:hypothetical protein